MANGLSTRVTWDAEVVYVVYTTVLNAEAALCLLLDLIILDLTTRGSTAPITELSTTNDLFEYGSSELYNYALNSRLTTALYSRYHLNLLITLSSDSQFSNRLDAFYGVCPSFRRVDTFLWDLLTYRSRLLITITGLYATNIFLIVHSRRGIITDLRTTVNYPLMGCF